MIEAEPGGTLARARSYVGLFSPSRATYEVLLTEIADVSRHMRTTRAFCVEFLADLRQGISGVLEYDDKDLRATVKNETGLSLRTCRAQTSPLSSQHRRTSSAIAQLASLGQALADAD